MLNKRWRKTKKQTYEEVTEVRTVRKRTEVECSLAFSRKPKNHER